MCARTDGIHAEDYGVSTAASAIVNMTALADAAAVTKAQNKVLTVQPGVYPVSPDGLVLDCHCDWGEC
jgi:hypothetical protein